MVTVALAPLDIRNLVFKRRRPLRCRRAFFLLGMSRNKTAVEEYSQFRGDHRIRRCVLRRFYVRKRPLVCKFALFYLRLYSRQFLDSRTPRLIGVKAVHQELENKNAERKQVGIIPVDIVRPEIDPHKFGRQEVAGRNLGVIGLFRRGIGNLERIAVNEGDRRRPCDKDVGRAHIADSVPFQVDCAHNRGYVERRRKQIQPREAAAEILNPVIGVIVAVSLAKHRGVNQRHRKAEEVRIRHV